MTDLYNTLGVEPDADPATIKKAHRRAVARLHPDNQDTGDRDGFEAAQKAFEILSDPEKRDRYDKTGDTESRADNRASQIIAIAVGAFTNAARSADLVHDDICAIAVRALAENCRLMKDQIGEGREAIDDMTSARERVTRKSGDNFIATAMSAMIADQERNIALVEDAKAKHEAAIDMLKTFEYQTDERPVAPTQSHAADAFQYAMQKRPSDAMSRTIYEQMMAEMKRYKF